MQPRQETAVQDEQSIGLASLNIYGDCTAALFILCLSSYSDVSCVIEASSTAGHWPLLDQR